MPFRYNPILGEFFRCRYDYPDGSHGFYIAEQVSHHPPVSAFYYVSPANHIVIMGELRPKSKFLGNSVSTNMEGENRVILLGKPEDGGASTIPRMLLRYSFSHRVCHYHAQHVRARNTIWQDGPGTRGYLHCEKRQTWTRLRPRIQNKGTA